MVVVIVVVVVIFGGMFLFASKCLLQTCLGPANFSSALIVCNLFPTVTAEVKLLNI